MKKLFILLITTALLCSCSKAKDDMPEGVQKEPISVTLWLHFSNTDQPVMLSYHDCEIGEPALIEQWKVHPDTAWLCDGTKNFIVLKKAKPCGDNCTVRAINNPEKPGAQYHE